MATVQTYLWGMQSSIPNPLSATHNVVSNGCVVLIELMITSLQQVHKGDLGVSPTGP